MTRSKLTDQLNGFTDTLKMSIIRRDRYTCQECGKNDTIEVHHVDGNPTNNDSDNLTCLCRGCHVIRHCDKPIGVMFDEFIDRCKHNGIDPYELLDSL